MPNICLQTAATLTGLSLSTLRRRIADGTLKCADNNTANNKIMICFDSIKNDICIPLEPDDIELIKNADAGEPQAQNELALLFLE
jgi:predicted transcriptional regulator